MNPADPNLELYRSVLHLSWKERRQRMQHLPRSERERVRTTVEREDHAQRLQENIAGRDLIQMALLDPSKIIERLPLKYALLGRTTYQYDEDKMVTRITNDVARSSQTLVDMMANFDRGARPLPLEAWKLVYCDVYYVDGGDATLQEVYEARLREDELQTPAARARELVRYNALKRARRNSKWMIPAIERLSLEEKTQPDPKDKEAYQRLLEQSHDRELKEKLMKQTFYKQALERVWKQVSPEPPVWVRHILHAQQQWGFVYYLSREADQRYGRNWQLTWDQIDNHCSPTRVTYASIHSQGTANWIKMQELETENWPIFNQNDNIAEDEDLRKHFKQYIEEGRSQTRENERNKGTSSEDNDGILSPGLLRNTFIVIPAELVSGNLGRRESEILDPYWVWAYDADWDGSAEETISSGEKYQGRVKVAIWSVNSWFYAARWEGVNLRDMWLKAQQHPEKLWICYSKELEEWDHEPYI
ncbi:hypothetical protein FHETE_8824 [Fusarium heterosporum]|uniref:Uncharacterized protein n=1 Tax=Fusarium heterosporum TaxID=42747 RepID=A0A8H5WHY2_FUSHE|nr:hypothetical protein FHETE_8824 [Fusarium heterosporum]